MGYEYLKKWRENQPNIKEIRAEEARKWRAAHPEVWKAIKKRYRERHREKLLPMEAAQAAQRRKNDPEGNRRRMDNFLARKKAKQEIEMGRPRPEICEMCSQPPTGRGNKPGSGICFDHCHATGTARGWLCDRCNKVLGLVGDNAVLLRAMASYLEVYSGKTNSS